MYQPERDSPAAPWADATEAAQETRTATDALNDARCIDDLLFR